MSAPPRSSRGTRAASDGEPALRDSPSWPAPWLALALGLVSGAITLFVWRDVTPRPNWHDEAAYVLQAEILAGGRWSAPSPPRPELFEQTHVLVHPVVASKYTPGHSLLLALGVSLGWAALVPLILGAATGALVFALSARLGGPVVGLLSWWLWTASPDSLLWRSSFLSQVTTAFLILAAWWLLLRWREGRAGGGAGGRAWMLAGLAGVVGWGAITRPFTMLMLFIPIGWVVLSDVRRRRAWRELILPGVVGMAILGILPLSNVATLGSVTESPRSLYTSQYMPWDRIGFGLDETPPARVPHPQLEELADQFRGFHRAHVPTRLPAIVGERLGAYLETEWAGWRLLLVPLAILGTAAHARIALFPWISVGLLFGGYLTYAYGEQWTAYYVEWLPVGAFFAAAGIVTLVSRAIPKGDGSGPFGGPRNLAIGGVALWLAIAGISDIRRARVIKWAMFADVSWSEPCIAALPAGSGVFVRYAPEHSPHQPIVANVSDLDGEPVITAHDRGAENAELMRELPERRWFLLDEANAVIFRVGADGGPTGSPVVTCSRPPRRLPPPESG